MPTTEEIQFRGALSREAAEALLARFFERNGCLRLPKKGEGNKAPHRGYEIRLVANSQRELDRIQQCLAIIGFKFGRSFQKRNQFIQPIYGDVAMGEFIKIMKRFF